MDQGDFHLWMAIVYFVMITLVLLGAGVVCVYRIFKGMCDDADDH